MKLLLTLIEYISHIEKGMEVLFSLMPAMQLPAIGGVGQLRTVEEWSEAVRGFRKARKSFPGDLQQRDGQLIEVLKKVQTKAKLVRIGSIPLTELGRLKAWILNTESNGMWDALVDVVAALQHADGSVKRQWLVDAVELAVYLASFHGRHCNFLGCYLVAGANTCLFLILDQLTVLSDYQSPFPLLLSDSSWGGVAGIVVPSLFASTERIYNWAIHIARCEDMPPDMETIDKVRIPWLYSY
ncbi:unnamed protein product [Prunus armeniaca]|uniref:Uncharacterized protein n=1 Tax=Prunus armeniaca TaxID=36596 RepID=A0A6J5UH77_PRUAR|nr:unnamed protein product [Prunus armeniaca]